MSDVTSRIPKYEALFQKVAADYSPMPLMIDDRFIRAVAMAFAELDARVAKLEGLRVAASQLCGGAVAAADFLDDLGWEAATKVLRAQIQACLEALGGTGVVLGKKGGA